MSAVGKTFLTAEWRKLAMANYPVDPELLRPFVPPKTILDQWNGRCYVSLVAFMFMNTRVMGMKIPFHVNFEEMNLRFYVRCGEKRGVVFIKELVGKPMVTLVANGLYNENYETVKVDHSWQSTPTSLDVEYRWKKANWNSFRVSTDKTAHPIAAGSEEEFITEHYWGYTRSGKASSFEYEVGHPRWDVYPMRSFGIDVDFGDLYGARFGFLSKVEPTSVFLAEGSQIVVKGKREI